MKRTAESVTEGHPDKVCDQIADGILDACLKQDPDAHTAIEVMASKNTLMIAGELSQGVRESGAVNPVTIARQVVREIGYTSEETGLDADRCNVLTNVNVQSWGDPEDALIEVLLEEHALDVVAREAPRGLGQVVGAEGEEIRLQIGRAHV